MFGGPPEALFEGHVRRFLTTKSSMVKPCWRVHFLCKSNAVLGDEIPYLCLQIGYLGFSKFWLFDFKFLKNQQFVFQHTQLFYFYNYQKTVDTYPRYCTLDCTYQVLSWYLDNVLNYNKKKLKKYIPFFRQKTFFENISRTMARSGTRITALLFTSKHLPNHMPIYTGGQCWRHRWPQAGSFKVTKSFP